MPASWNVPEGMIDVQKKYRQHDHFCINFIKMAYNKLENQINLGGYSV